MALIAADFTSCLIFRKRGKDIQYLLLKRADGLPYQGIWQYVTGSIEPGEHTIRAVMREIAEETGLRAVRLYRYPDIARFYLPCDDKIHISSVFLADAGAGDNVIISNEHSEYRWVRKKEGMRLLYWPFDKAVLDMSSSIINSDIPQNLFEIKDIAKYLKI